MAKKPDISYEQAKELFVHIDGVLYKRVGSLDKDSNYKRTKANGKLMLVHRIIFLLEHGYLPDIVDHIDGNRTNNKIENLRAATKTENNRNSKKRKDNTSGYKNVNWHSQKQKWQVRLLINGKSTSFGLYDDLEFAELVAIEARNKYHGNFARHI